MDWTDPLVIVGAALAALAAATLGAYVSSQIFRRRLFDQAEIYAGLYRGASSEGSIHSNWVDELALHRLAADLGIPASPVRVEEQTGRGSSRAVALSVGRASGELGRTASSARTEIHEPPFDYERLTSEVVERLRDQNRVNVDLGRVSSSVPTSTADLVELLARVRDEVELPADLAERLQRVASDALFRDKQEEFARVARERPYVVVEGTWRIIAPGEGGLVLELAELRSASGEAIQMPTSLMLEVPVPLAGPISRGGAGLTSRGVSRLKGSTVAAATGVLGTPETFDDGRLRVTPIVVFDRVGAMHLHASTEWGT